MCTYYAHILNIFGTDRSGICTFICAPCALAAKANKQHRKSTSKVKEKKGKQIRKLRVDVAAKATVVSSLSVVSSYAPTTNTHLRCSSAFSAVVSLLLFSCCCLIFVCVYLAFDLRLCLHEDHDEDQDEDQDDKTKIKTAMNTKIKAKTQHTHLVIVTEATLVILGLHLRRAVLL